MALTVESILPHVPLWTLVLVRLAGLFTLSPLFGSAAIPGRIKVFWAVAMSLCVYPVLLARPESGALLRPMLASDWTLLALPAAVAMELAVGVVIGYGAGLVLQAMQVAGQTADQQIGTGLAGVFNPDMGDDQHGVVSQFYYVLAIMLFVILGGHRAVLQTLLNSFDVVPLGGFRADAHLLQLMAGLLTSMLELALRISAPLLCLVFLETAAMGFVARTMPQMNLLSIGFPVRILMGLGVVLLALSSHAGVFARALHRDLQAVAGYLAG